MKDFQYVILAKKTRGIFSNFTGPVKLRRESVEEYCDSMCGYEGSEYDISAVFETKTEAMAGLIRWRRNR